MLLSRDRPVRKKAEGGVEWTFGRSDDGCAGCASLFFVSLLGCFFLSVISPFFLVSQLCSFESQAALFFFFFIGTYRLHISAAITTWPRRLCSPPQLHVQSPILFCSACMMILVCLSRLSLPQNYWAEA